MFEVGVGDFSCGLSDIVGVGIPEGSLVASDWEGGGVQDFGGQGDSLSPFGGLGGKQLFSAARVPKGGISPLFTWALWISCSIRSHVSQSKRLPSGSQGATLTKASHVLRAWELVRERPQLLKRKRRDLRAGSLLEDECPIIYGGTLT